MASVALLMPDDPVPVSLVSLDNKIQLVGDLVTGVAKNFKHGLYLYGDGGIGKSYLVLNKLDELGVPYKLHNSRCTAKGLFTELKAAPDMIHIFEDMERLVKDPDAQGVLRSACWSQPGHERMVTWTTAKDGKVEFPFRGGLILISNRPLTDLPELRAMATRIEVLMFELTEEELTAQMQLLASRGYLVKDKVVIDPATCIEITEFLLSMCRAEGCRLDLRLQQKAFQTYLQWEADETKLNWKDLVRASVNEATQHFRHESNPLPKEERRTQRRNMLRQILEETSDVKEQERRYKEETDGSRADFFRRKREIESGEFDEADA
jgi:hypothetical protein